MISLKTLLVGFLVGGMLAGAGFAFALATSDDPENSGAAESTVEQGFDLTPAEAEQAERATEARESGELAPTPELSLAVEGAPRQDLVEQCRVSEDSGTRGVQEFGIDALHCSALVKIDDGKLEPTGQKGDGTPIWNYSESELRALAGE